MENKSNIRKYIVYNLSELDTIDFRTVLETSRYTITYSVDETKSFVKWEGDVPQCVRDLKSKEGPYSNQEMIELLDTPEWNPDAVKPSLLTRIGRFFGFGNN
jgi:hypothetical protein